MRFRFSNNASALVTSTVTTAATNIVLETGGGSKFPPLSGDDVFRGTLISVSGTKEVVHATAVTGDTITVDRAQEGTAAQTFASGSRFELRITAGLADNWLQRIGDNMNGDLDMGGHNITNAAFPQPVRFVHINAQLIRPIDIDPNSPYNPSIETSSIVIPPQSSGGRPSYHNSNILNQSMFTGIVLDWLGDVNHVPPWFRLCNGTNGTPDLRGRYIKGWLDTFGPGGYGGHASEPRSDPADDFSTGWGLAVDGAGSHAHGSVTQSHVLTLGQMPAHAHSVDGTRGAFGGSGTGTLGDTGARNTDIRGNSEPHSHGINADGHHIHWVHQPPFYVLAKVMFL